MQQAGDEGVIVAQARRGTQLLGGNADSQAMQPVVLGTVAAAGEIRQAGGEYDAADFLQAEKGGCCVDAAYLGMAMVAQAVTGHGDDLAGDNRVPLQIGHQIVHAGPVVVQNRKDVLDDAGKGRQLLGATDNFALADMPVDGALFHHCLR